MSDEIREIEQRPDSEFADIAHLASGARGRSAVLTDGDIEGGMWWAGQSQGLIHDVPTVAELIERMAQEAVSVIQDRLMRLVPGDMQ